MVEVNEYCKTINSYIVKLDKQMADHLFQLLEWNNEIRDNNIPVNTKTKSWMLCILWV